MGRCILICHLLNNPMLMNHFPIWEPVGKKHNTTQHNTNIRGLVDFIPVIHKAPDRRAQRAALLPRLGLLVSAPPTSQRPSPPLRLSYLSLPPSFSLWPFLSPWWQLFFSAASQAGAVNTPLLRPRTLGDPATPVSLMSLPRSLTPRPLCCIAVFAAQTL